MRSVCLLAALLAALALATGCERRGEHPPAAGAPAATLVATSGYGVRTLLDTRVAPGQSVMRALRGATQVDTAYGGGFVSGMLGLQSNRSGQRDWFFYVNGIAGAVSARQVPVADGDTVWWDYRPWGALIQAPAVVGLWPAPFAHPGGGGPAVSADPPLREALARAGVRLTTGRSAWRVRVGASDDIARRDPAWRRALADPSAAGLSVRIEGGAIAALPPGGGGPQPVPGARALVAAVPTGTAPSDGVLLAVAGLDAAAARAAAERVARDPSVLRLRYAVAFDGRGTPLRGGGREGP